MRRYRGAKSAIGIRWVGPWRLVQQTRSTALWRRPGILTKWGLEHVAMGPGVEREGTPDLEECARYHQ